jgi:hypothetical protein
MKILFEFIVREHSVCKGVPATEDKVLSRPIRIAQLLQGNEPLHTALDVALVSLRTSTAIVGGELACAIPFGGAR